MKKMRVIYSMILAVIYITATSLSSISILSCDHHHHHHHHQATEHTEHEHHCSACSCCDDMVAIADDCCDHHHRVLGDNHTDFFVNNERNDLRTIISLSLLTTPAVLAEAYGDVDIYSPSFSPLIYGDEASPLRVAAVGTRALRAPPTLA